MPTTLQKSYQDAAAHLSSRDPYLAPIISTVGLCTIQPHGDYYQDLVESIIGQQLSVKAAASIRDRFRALFADNFPTPDAILAKDIDTLRSAGLSRPKALYVQDIARHVIEGKVSFDHLPDLSNEAIIKELTDIKGVGEWTVHMFLMFCMGRLDIIAHGDLGIRNGVQKVYRLDHLPSPQEIDDIAKRYQWQPYASIACWYLWRALDTMPDL